jgi:hypothetical protein
VSGKHTPKPYTEPLAFITTIHQGRNMLFNPFLTFLFEIRDQGVGMVFFDNGR